MGESIDSLPMPQPMGGQQRASPASAVLPSFLRTSLKKEKKKARSVVGFGDRSIRAASCTKVSVLRALRAA